MPDVPTDDKLDWLIEAIEDSRLIPPWLTEDTQEQRREKLRKWLASDRKPMRVIHGPRWFERKA